MAAFDTPWMTTSMPANNASDVAPGAAIATGEAPTIASFAPNSSVSSSTLARQRATILVHKKSPLLTATPPQVTRALAYSHAFLLPLNKLVGLLSWTTGDPWESFLLVAGFWGIILYGDVVVRWAGPLVLAMLLIVGMYARRYSPLSSTSWTRTGQSSKQADGKVRHHKSLDEIVETLREFTTRCNILLDPLIQLTDFVSTAQTATSATTRPALTSLFLRVLLLTPIWYGLTLSPLRLITTSRVFLTIGTFVLSWHSRPAIVSRTILWRSRTVRRACAKLTGLDSLADAYTPPPKTYSSKRIPQGFAALALSQAVVEKQRPEGVQFTFVLFENQRRWLGIGWTSSMLAYERASWTDEQLNASPPKESFELPEVEGGLAKWEWCEGGTWELDPAVDEDDETEGNKRKGKSPKDDKSKSVKAGDEGWLFYDNKWRDPRREDGWGRYTRRRKWCRDAELVEVRDAGASATKTEVKSPASKDTKNSPAKQAPQSPQLAATSEAGVADTDALSIASNSPGKVKGTWFRRRPRTRSNTTESSTADAASETRSITHEREREEDDYDLGRSYGSSRSVREDWVGEDVRMELG